MNKVVKYVRIPVKNQKKILEEQQKELMQYAEQKGFEVAEVGMLCKKTGETEQMQGIFADGGITHKIDMNYKEAFHTMLDKAMEGMFNQIIMKDITEFIKAITIDLETAFVVIKPMEVIKELRECGVNIYFEKENINSIEEDTTLEDLIKVRTRLWRRYGIEY